MFDLPDFDAHESVTHVADARSGLRAIIAVHSTQRGPAAGGCRFWRYPSARDAAIDALRLSRAMSYKNAMAGLPMGGGKAVLVSDGRPKTPAVLELLGRAIEELRGRYVTAEDVGMTTDDMVAIGRHTRHVAGLPPRPGELGGSPSPPTALGVFEGLRAAVGHRLGRDLAGVHIAVQGVGHVGAALAERLAAAGARLTLADLDRAKAQALAARLGAAVAGAEEIHTVDADVLSPNALGGTLSARTIPAIRAKVVAGAANNQLETAEDGRRLHRRGILWAPDYVINAGGIMWVTAQYLGERDAEAALARVRSIGGRVAEVLAQAKEADLPPGEVADGIARRLIGRA